MKRRVVASIVVGLALGLALAGTLFYMRGGGGRQVAVFLTPGPPQPRVPPGEAGMDPAALEAAAEYAGKRNTRALVVGHGGHIVFERYWEGTTSETAVDPGFAPVLVALGVGSAMNDRLLGNLDAPLSNYLPEAEGEKAGFSVRQLLGGDAPGMSPAESADLLGVMLERVSSQPYPTFVAERFWKPLGAGALEFRQAGGNRSGSMSAACCVRARVGDWMRIGELLAHDGVFQGNQFTPPRYVTLMMKLAHKDSGRGFFMRVDGDFAAQDVAWLEGSDQQRLWIVPSLRLAILRIGAEAPSSEGWDEAMIPDSIIRGTSGWKPRSAGEGIDPKKYAPH
jgi:CubicO group peptidase (beta-lactamase class C family)